MNVQELREILEKTEDRISIFADVNMLSECDDLENNITGLINDFLTDEQKAELFELEHFREVASEIKKDIIQSIFNRSIKLQLLKDGKITEGIDKDDALEIIELLDDDEKNEIMRRKSLLCTKAEQTRLGKRAREL